MRTAVTVGMVTLTLLGSVSAASAQELTAEVRTWGGQTIRLSQPTLEVFYTLLPQDREVPGAPATRCRGRRPAARYGVPAPGRHGLRRLVAAGDGRAGAGCRLRPGRRRPPRVGLDGLARVALW